MTEKRFTIGNVLTKYSGLRDNGKLMTFNEVVDLLNEQHEEIQAFKDKLCELGISDVKYNGKRYDTGLEEWLE